MSRTLAQLQEVASNIAAEIGLAKNTASRIGNFLYDLMILLSEEIVRASNSEESLFNKCYYAIKAQIKAYNSDYKFKGFATPDDDIPGSPVANDVYFVITAGTVFGLIANSGDLIYYTGSSFALDGGISKEEIRAKNAELANSTNITALQSIIHSVVDNGFHVADENGNVGLRYNENGLDAALLSTHFQSLINSLITTMITAARGTTLAPLVNSLIPATYLPSYVDDVIDIDIFGTTAIAQYCSDNDGNTEILTDKFCYDDENKIFQIARQIDYTIDLIEKGTPESGKIYIDVNTNKSYRWSGTIMVEISNSIALGETANTAYAGDKGATNAMNIASLFSSLAALTTSNTEEHHTYSDDLITLHNLVNALTTNNASAHSIFLSAITTLQSLIRQITENGFNVVDENGNVGMKYDENGLDAALLSSHFQGLINALISTLITAAKGSSIAPLVNSLIPATYLPSYVDDVVDIDIFGTTAITQYCSDNDGNTSTLEDKFCYDDENKIFQLAKQVGTSIDLIEKGSPESGKIYIDVNTNKSYRWSGTTMAEISSSISLGETAYTAYAGDKGKLNATNIATAMSLINGLSTTLSTISSLVQQVSESGYYVSDASGNVAMKYDENGLDVALLSTHLISLIKSAIGTTGENDDRIFETEEEGFFVVDQDNNIIFSIDPVNGVQFAKIGDKAKEAIEDAGVTGGINYTILSSVDL